MGGTDERSDAGGVRRGHRRPVQPGVVVAVGVLDESPERGLEVEVAGCRGVRRQHPPTVGIERRRLEPRATRRRDVSDVAVRRVPRQQVLRAGRRDDDDTGDLLSA